MIDVELVFVRGEYKFMFKINIESNGINIRNIEEEDILYIQKWFNYQQLFYTDKNKPLDLKEFYERYLEYYLSEGEFFLKILKEDTIVGMIKGRVEFKNPNEVWIGCFMIDRNLRNKGFGSKILKGFTNYLWMRHGICIFYSGVIKGDNSALNFWKGNGFTALRVAKDYFSTDGKKEDLLILRKVI